MQQDDLDKKATGVFAEKVLRKDLEAKIRIGSDALEEKAVQHLLSSRRFIRRKR